MTNENGINTVATKCKTFTFRNLRSDWDISNENKSGPHCQMSKPSHWNQRHVSNILLCYFNLWLKGVQTIKKTVVKQPKQHLHWGFLAPEEHHTEGGKTCCLGQLKGPFCHASTGHEHHDVTDPEFVWAFHPARYLCHYLCLTMA